MSVEQQRQQAEVEFFDGFVEEHGDYDLLGEGAYARLLARFEALCRPLPRERCLDCGCGTGAFTRRLRKFDLDLLGIDVSPGSIRSAQERSTGEDYRVGDITHLELPDQSADVAVFSCVLHHCPESQLRKTILAEAFRVLRPGGRVFAFDPSAHSPSMWLYRSPSSPLFSSVGKTENEVLLTRAQLTSELSAAGFERIEVRGIGGITYCYVEGRIARALLPLYNVYEQLITQGVSIREPARNVSDELWREGRLSWTG